VAEQEKERPVEESRKIEVTAEHFSAWLDALAEDAKTGLRDYARGAPYVAQLVGQIKQAITDFLRNDRLPVIYRHSREDLEVGGKVTTVKEQKERQRPQ